MKTFALIILALIAVPFLSVLGSVIPKSKQKHRNKHRKRR